MFEYLISIPTSSGSDIGTIHHRQSKLKIRVFNLLTSKFIPRKGEISFFVTEEKNTFAFETYGYKKHQHVLILHMISRYCIYMGLNEAQIHADWPSAA